jgi:APA family basic amino acid/polyamine antiporter
MTAAVDLPRKLGLVDLLAIAIGNMIGAAIFLTPAIVAKNLPSPWWILAAWAFAGLMSLAGALSFAELGTLMPQSGGQYVYLRDSFGRFWGFLFGWTTFIVIRTGGLASLAVGFSIYFSHFVPISAVQAKLLSVSMLLGLAWINYKGVREGAAVQILFTALKLAGLAAIVLAAAFSSRPGATDWGESASGFTLTAFGVALVPCLWAFQGWFSVPMVAGEARNPARTLPLSLGLSVVAVTAVYLLVNIAFLKVYSPLDMRNVQRIGSEAMQALIGPAGAGFVSACIMVSIVGAMNAGVMAGPRVYFAQARDGLFPGAFARIHPQNETPGFSIWGQAVWASILAASGSYELLITYASFASWLFYGLTAIAVILLRNLRPEAPRPFRVWAYPWTPLLFAIVSFAFVLNTVIASPLPSLGGLALITAGIPIFWRMEETARRREGRGQLRVEHP